MDYILDRVIVKHDERSIKLHHLLVKWACVDFWLAKECADLGDDEEVVFHGRDYIKSPQVVKHLDFKLLVNEFSLT
jgi:hypothetical protein